MSYKEDALLFLGITKWHEHGYTGKNIKIMSDEKIHTKSPTSCSQDLWDKVICPNGYSSKKGGHGTGVMAHILLVCPDAECIAYPMNVNSSSEPNKEYNSPCADYILQNNVTIFTTSSLSGYISNIKKKAMQDCINNGCTFFSAVGNKGSYNGESRVYGESKAEEYLAIGGIKPRYTKNKYDWTDLYKVNYSSEGEELDYMTIAEILSQSGTSFCSPIFAGMCGLVQQFFLEKIGRTLYREELVKFINDNLIDTGAVGFDIETGHGLFILPNPETIDISKYVEDYKEEVMVDGIIIDLIPEGNINRPGIKNTCKYITVHNTDNYTKYANARAHANYLKYTDEKKSWHLTVDDTSIYRHLPDEECGYHTGDGFTTQSGNRNSIGIEICVNQDGDLAKATDNAIRLIRMLMAKHNIPIENVVQHNNWSGKDCPHELRLGNPYTWETFIDKIMEVEKPMENEVSDWAKQAWEWACSEERRYLDGTNPKGTITREMLAQVLFNLFGKNNPQ